MHSLKLGKRLDAITGARNTRCFAPNRDGDSWLIPRHDGLDPLDHEETDRMAQCIAVAFVQNGFRILSLDECTFKLGRRSTRSTFFDGPRKDEKRRALMKLHSRSVKLAISETNV
jgi:hypothetical protein